MPFPITLEEHTAIKAMIEKPKELIVAAAVQYQGATISFPRPARHAQAIGWLHQRGFKQPPEGYHCGFLTNYGRFVDREEAGRITRAAKQGTPIMDPAINPNGCLYSEDLWLEPEDIQGPVDPERVF